jgi:hypothetical protein
MGGVPLFSELNEITSVLQMSVTNQQGFIFTEFSFRYYCSSLEDAVVIV